MYRLHEILFLLAVGKAIADLVVLCVAADSGTEHTPKSFFFLMNLWFIKGNAVRLFKPRGKFDGRFHLIALVPSCASIIAFRYVCPQPNQGLFLKNRLTLPLRLNIVRAWIAVASVCWRTVLCPHFEAYTKISKLSANKFRVHHFVSHPFVLKEKSPAFWRGSSLLCCCLVLFL